MPAFNQSLRGLPQPTAAQAAHSARLRARISQAITRAGGAIDFETFMDLALYAPGLGYYSATPVFGAGGDFVTAPELSPLFGACVARQCAQWLGPGDALLEVEAGSGILAAQVLEGLARAGALPEAYYILELGAGLRAAQQARLAEQVPELARRVHWLDRLPGDFRGIVLANEALDSMPVQRFRLCEDGVELLQVGCAAQGFVWRGRPAGPALAARIAARTAGLAAGYVSEMGVQAEAWMGSVVEAMHRGVILLFDYGFPRHEFYHPQRSGGTLMCHFRHRAHEDPLRYPGIQDITAHLDFSAIATAARQAGATLLGYTSQAAFLLGAGLVDDPDDAREGDLARARFSQQVQTLTSPAEMGELFKVMALGVGVTGTPPAFTLNDRRHTL